jgi:hypothetical protein
MNIKTIEEFDVIENRAGNLMFVLHEQDGEPSSAATMTIGENNSAVLNRSASEALNLVEIPDDAAKALNDVKTVKITEMAENGDFAYVYDVDIV